MQDRIIQIMRNYGLNAAQFAEKVGVQPSSVSHILAGRNKPSLDFVTKVLTAFPSLDFQWLVLGKGAMLKANTEYVNTILGPIAKTMQTDEEEIRKEKENNRYPHADEIYNGKIVTDFIGISDRFIYRGDVIKMEKEKERQAAIKEFEQAQNRLIEDAQEVDVEDNSTEEKDNPSQETINTIPKPTTVKNKKIKQIIVLFDDGTFEIR